MLPNLSALALGRQEAPTAGLLGKKKTPEEKKAKEEAKAADKKAKAEAKAADKKAKAEAKAAAKKAKQEAEAAAKKDKVIAEFRALFVEFFRSACHYYTAGLDYDYVNLGSYDEREERRRTFGELEENASLCEGKKSDEVRLPHQVWWDIVYHYEENPKIIDEEFPGHRKDNGNTIFFDFSKADRAKDRGYMEGTVWEQYYMNVVYWRSKFPDKSAEMWATKFLEAPATWVSKWTAKRLKATAPPKKKKPSGV
jgi:hypothetical protein